MRLAICLAALFAATTAEAGCGPAEDSCEIDGGTYELVLPASPKPNMPAMMFVHGYGSSGKGALKMTGMVNEALDRGYAVIAPTGTQRPGRRGHSWSFHPDFPERRDEIAFLTAVRDDAAARFGINADRILLAGFSIGGSMTAYLACAEPGAFAAYAPIGGNFWRPHPETCAGPVKMLHTHGWRDTTVPLEGRVLRGDDAEDPDAVMQGDVFAALQIWRETNGCLQLRADRFVTDDQYWRRIWDRCAEGSALELALFDGGHAIPKGWAKLALDWFEGQTGG